MLIQLWQEILIKPIFNFLVFTNFHIGSLGISIIVLTLIIKTLLVPLNIPAIKMQVKKKELDVETKKLKEKYSDKTELAKAQMELYKKHGVNPASGCLPLVVQIFVFIALYTVLRDLLANHINSSLYYFEYLKTTSLNANFLYLSLEKPDPFYLLPVLAGVSQFFMSKMMLPKVEKELQKAEKTKDTMDDMMVSMQQQMLFVSPIMTFIVGITLPSGLSLYWFVSTVYSIAQNYIINKFIKK